MPLFTEKEVRARAKKTNTNPSEAQIEAGNYKKATIPWNGLTLKIENPRGSTRSGTGPEHRVLHRALPPSETVRLAVATPQKDL